MVGLPSSENREKILRTLLSKEKTEDLDFQELATVTEGYTGSDLKVVNLFQCQMLSLTHCVFDCCLIKVHFCLWRTEFMYHCSLSTCPGAHPEGEAEGYCESFPQKTVL